MPDSPSSTALDLLIEALDCGQFPFLNVTSDSMVPLVRSGNQFQLGPTSPETLAVGDMIVVGSDEDLLAHRYWGVSEKKVPANCHPEATAWPTSIHPRRSASCGQS
jgi:hypothetical protein